MHGLSLSPAKLRLYSYHKWVGVTVVILAALRVSSVGTDRLPDSAATIPLWENIAATVVRALLHFLIFAVPVSGWLTSSAQGFQTVLFGLVPIPDLVLRDRALAPLLEELHKVMTFVMLALVAGHSTAALKHHFFTRDDVLARMIPFLRRSAPSDKKARGERGAISAAKPRKLLLNRRR
jgi:cytochrome b561